MTDRWTPIFSQGLWWLCATCGAVVADKQAHDDWHAHHDRKDEKQ